MSVPASIFSFWNGLVAHGREGVFLVLVGFLGSFGFIRTSARLMRSPRVPWWPGSVVSSSGVHMHHLVWGICLMTGAGVIGFAFYGSRPVFDVCAALFGVGAGLTLDEFALLVYLDDVYWAREGRASIDAAVFAAGAMAVILLGVKFEVTTGSVGETIATVAVLGFLFSVVVVSFAKLRLVHGALGVLIFPIAVYGAVRLGKPGSPWARRFYGARRPHKQAKAEARFSAGRRTERFKERLRDIVGGETAEAYAARLADEAARREAALQLAQRADRLAAAEPGSEKASASKL
jgi:hypothetical protein